MNAELEARRRVLAAAYRRYLVADRDLQAAQSGARLWFRQMPARQTALIGDPGSRIRALTDRRDRAMARLSLALAALQEARRRFRRNSVRVIEIRRLSKF
jgi:hypothetical protein